MSGIETNNVVERLRRRTAPVMGGAGLYEVVLDERPDALCAEAADEIERLQSERQSLSDRIDVLEGENRQLKIDRLTILAMVYHIAPATVAKMCDEQLDRSGALLGEVREIDRRASLTQGGKTNG